MLHVQGAPCGRAQLAGTSDDAERTDVPCTVYARVSAHLVQEGHAVAAEDGEQQRQAAEETRLERSHRLLKGRTTCQHHPHAQSFGSPDAQTMLPAPQPDKAAATAADISVRMHMGIGAGINIMLTGSTRPDVASL